MQIHLYLSLFFLPMALIYTITGSLYVFGVRHEALAEVVEIKIFQDIPKGEERAAILETLAANSLRVPKDTEVHFARNRMIMGDLRYQVTLSKVKEREYILRSINRNFYGVLLSLHRSHGKYYFDILAIGFSIALVLLYLSGFFITAFCKKDRKGSLIAVVLGFVITALAVYYSI